MTIFGIALTCKDEGRSERPATQKGFWYRDDLGEEGRAKWCSVAEQGACICISRDLQPGRELTIHGNGAEIYGRILWCRPMANKKHFVAGVRVLSTATTGEDAPQHLKLTGALHSA